MILLDQPFPIDTVKSIRGRVTELAEGLSSKNYKWDLEDNYWVPKDRNLYNSYFYIASDENTSVLDKFRLHGREFTELLDGSIICLL